MRPWPTQGLLRNGKKVYMHLISAAEHFTYYEIYKYYFINYTQQFIGYEIYNIALSTAAGFKLGMCIP
jgi:hypothetical protein